ncbi:nuclease-related domain-containing protein, partial [Streptomyces hainanensis]
VYKRQAPRPTGPPPVDLADNRPGQALRAKIDDISPSFWHRLLARLLGRRTEADSWRAGLVGERKAGDELDRLTARGWHVVHSIPLPRDVDIDHLLIGPGGVYSVNTKRHPGARIWVGDHAARVRGQSYPYPVKSRREAARAAAALTRACGFPVDVRPVLLFVDAANVTVVPTLSDVTVVRHHREVAAFKRLDGVLTAPAAARVHAAARDPRTWERA